MKWRIVFVFGLPLALFGILSAVSALYRTDNYEPAREALLVARVLEQIALLDLTLEDEAVEIYDQVRPDGQRSVHYYHPPPALVAFDKVEALLADPEISWSSSTMTALSTLRHLWDVPPSNSTDPAEAIADLAAKRRELLSAVIDDANGTSAASDQQVATLVSLMRSRSFAARESVEVFTAAHLGSWTPGTIDAFSDAVVLGKYHLDDAQSSTSVKLPVPEAALTSAREAVGPRGEPTIEAVNEWQSAHRAFGARVVTSMKLIVRGVVETAERVENEAFRRRTALLVAVAAESVLTIGLLILGAFWFIRRVRRLTNFAADFVATGEFHPLHDKRRDELGELGRALDSMARRIDESKHLAQIEASALEMIAEGRPMGETLKAIGSLFNDPQDPDTRFTIGGELEGLDPSATDSSVIANRTRLLNLTTGESSALPGSTQGRMAQSLVTLALRRAAEDRALEEQATRDELTGLLNRRSIIETLESSLSRKSRDEGLGIIYVDLDEFKEANDRFGHAIGDEILIIQSQRISSLISGVDGEVGRLGGDEFLCVVSSARDDDELMRIGERLVDELSQPIETSAAVVLGSASVGGAMSRQGVRADQLLQEADVALYDAKDRGRRIAAVSTPRLRRRTSESERLKSAVRSAIELDEFVVRFQPVWRIRDGVPMLRAFEALVRWNRPGVGIVPPGVFVGMAEELRLMARLDALVFGHVCRQLAEWSKSGLGGFSYGVNISPAWIEQPDFVEQVSSIITSSGCDPKALVFEVTEEIVMSDIEASRLRLGRLRELGPRIAVDDFGQGHSSLAYLRDLPIDILKADRRFISSVDREPRLGSIVATIRDLARSLDLEFIAEGVERREEFDCLVELGCSIVQGFWSGFPLSPSEAAYLMEYTLAGGTLAGWQERCPNLSLQEGEEPVAAASRRLLTDGAAAPAPMRKDDSTAPSSGSDVLVRQLDEILPQFRVGVDGEDRTTDHSRVE